MPTDLPPDYKPRPVNDPASPADPKVPGSVPAFPPEQGEDAKDPSNPDANTGGDVVDPPPGWRVPPAIPGVDQGDVPAPAGMPTF